MQTQTRDQIREAASLAMHYWPNAHLGAQTRREDLRSAFNIIRNRLNRGESLHNAVAHVEIDAYRHADM